MWSTGRILQCNGDNHPSGRPSSTWFETLIELSSKTLKTRSTSNTCMQSMSPLNSGLTIKPQSLTSTKDITIEGNHSFNPNQIVHAIPLLKLISRSMDATNESAWGNTKVWVSKYPFIKPQHLQLLEICTKNQSCISTIWVTIPGTEFRKRILCDSSVYWFCRGILKFLAHDSRDFARFLIDLGTSSIDYKLIKIKSYF